MQYKTIVLELIKDRPKLHDQLKSNRALLSTVEAIAVQLRDNHLALVEELQQSRPGSAGFQVKSEAMEIVVQEVQQALQDDSSEADTFSLEEAMEFLRRHAPPA